MMYRRNMKECKGLVNERHQPPDITDQRIKQQMHNTIQAKHHTQPRRKFILRNCGPD